jgi:hypothetical protein
MSLVRTDAFVPLTSAPVVPSGKTETRVTILAQSAAARPFQPVQGKDSGSSARSTGGVGVHPCEPKVTLQREGDRVSTIEVRCSCGRIIELACVYPEA